MESILIFTDVFRYDQTWLKASDHCEQFLSRAFRFYIDISASLWKCCSLSGIRCPYNYRSIINIYIVTFVDETIEVASQYNGDTDIVPASVEAAISSPIRPTDIFQQRPHISPEPEHSLISSTTALGSPPSPMPTEDRQESSQEASPILARIISPTRKQNEQHDQLKLPRLPELNSQLLQSSSPTELQLFPSIYSEEPIWPLQDPSQALLLRHFVQNLAIWVCACQN